MHPVLLPDAAAPTPPGLALGPFGSVPPALRPALALALGLLGGCAGLPGTPAGEPAPGGTVFEEVIIAPRPAEPPPPDPREEAVYKVLLAEVAGQRGETGIALENYRALLQAHPDDVALAERVTRVALYAKALDEAREAASIWLRLAPTSIDARQITASLQLHAGDLDGAQRNFEYVLASPEGEAAEKLRNVINLIGAEDDKAAALDLMRRIAQGRPQDPDIQFALALLAVRAGAMPEARQTMERVLALTPADPGMAMAYLGILQRQGDTEAAGAWLESLLRERPEDFDLRLIYARLLADAKRYPDARGEFERLAAARPADADVQYALGLLNLQMEDPDRARPYFERLLELGEYDAESSFYLGQIAEFRGRLAEAVDHYRAVDGGEFQFDAQLRAAALLARLDRLEEARAQLRMLAAADPANAARAVRAEAELLVERGQLEEAMAVYDRALATRGHDPDLLYSRAMLAERMGRLEVLERDLRAILAQDPDNAQALNALGYTLADRTERFDEAHELIQRALHISPQDFYALDSMGWVLYRMGRYDEALQYLRSAQAQRDDPEVAAHIVQVLVAKGEREEALRVLQAAEAAFPDSDKLRAARQLLGL